MIAKFGSRTHPRYRTRTTNLGMDIQPTAKATVSAVAAGQVVFSDRFLGYGNLAIVDHGDGYYTLYGNLDEISTAVGSGVTPGTTLGTVSDYLHFEIRNQGQPLDPEQWLCRRSDE
ncbi:MAG: peptidoglycan DD-metalloendopeptidase family protein [candidate division WOR-3 bacterium]